MKFIETKKTELYENNGLALSIEMECLEEIEFVTSDFGIFNDLIINNFNKMLKKEVEYEIQDKLFLLSEHKNKTKYEEYLNLFMIEDVLATYENKKSFYNFDYIFYVKEKIKEGYNVIFYLKEKIDE